MASMIPLDNTEWALVQDLFDPPGREGAPARDPRRQIVDAILFLARVEHAFASLGRWRRLSRCYEGSAESARARLEVAALGYLVARLQAEPA